MVHNNTLRHERFEVEHPGVPTAPLEDGAEEIVAVEDGAEDGVLRKT